MSINKWIEDISNETPEQSLKFSQVPVIAALFSGLFVTCVMTWSFHVQKTRMMERCGELHSATDCDYIINGNTERSEARQPEVIILEV